MTTVIKKPTDSSSSLPVLRALAESDDDAAFRLFIRLCRASPVFREWLWEEFARKSKTRMKVAGIIKRETPEDGESMFASENPSLGVEATVLRAKVPARIYGGLTWNEIEGLVRRYQAGKLNVGTFLLVNEGMRENHDNDASPRLMLASAEWFGAVVREGEVRLLRHVGNTLRFLASMKKAPARRGLFGYGDWWKLNVLFYILRHPSKCYRTRELRAHLLDLGIEVGTKDIRRFCTRHGIRRDMRAGRPRKH